MPPRGQVVLVAAVFVAAWIVKSLSWIHCRTEAAKVQSGVAEHYKLFARFLINEGISGFFSTQSQMANPDLLGHPPGYPFVLAVIYRLFGESDTAVQFLQIAADSVCAVLIVLIAAEMLHWSIAVVAGFLAALSPQFAWNSILLLPDTLAVLPLMLGFYLFVRARANESSFKIFAAGLLIGASCLLRANALLFTPFLIVASIVLKTHKRVLRNSLLLLTGTLVLIAPITLRNWIVFHRFVPLSIGAGQTLLEGIADYDQEGRFGFPDTDVELAKKEAVELNRPDYAATLFGPDGIERDKFRLREGINVIRSHPTWFVGVMVRRAAMMLRLERVPLISASASASVGYPRVLIVTQRIWTTVIMLPLMLFGVVLLAITRRWSVIAMFLIVPFYYFTVQSTLHTEYRYVLALNYFYFIFAATTICSIGRLIFAPRSLLN